MKQQQQHDDHVLFADREGWMKNTLLMIRKSIIISFARKKNKEFLSSEQKIGFLLVLRRRENQGRKQRSDAALDQR